MTMQLTAYSSVQINNFVKIVVPGYATLTFSDYHKNYSIAGTNYTGLGSLLSVGQNQDQIRATSATTNLVISGIPTTVVSDILNYPLNGCSMEMWRAVFDPATGNLIAFSGNPMQRFAGTIDNFAIVDEPGTNTEPGTITLTLTARSRLDQLNRKVSGRRTNPVSQKTFYPTDVSMDRVPTLKNSKFNFGAEV